MNNIKLFVSLLIAVLALSSAPAFAHVVIKSEQGNSKAVFHISPADDPIAGKQSTLFFDISSSETVLKNATAVLEVADEKTDAASTTPATIKDGTVSALYTFASGGTYTLRLLITNSDPSSEVMQFQYKQVVRAAASQTTAAKSTQLPLISFVSGILVLVALTSIYGSKRRQASLRNSINKP